MKATIIGVGNLGGAIAIGLAKGTFLDAKDITCVDTNPAALERLRETGLPFVLTSDLRKAIAGTDIFIMAVKSHILRDVIAGARDLLDFNRQIFFSVVAGVSLEELDHMLFDGPDAPPRVAHVHFRVIPNMAVETGQSMTFISALNANAAQIKLAEAIFGDMGQTMVIPERLMPSAMGVSSCGIAYVMRYVRAAMNGAMESGFSASDSRAIILQTIRGAVELLALNGRHPEEEIDRVVTPGGYTIRGLNAMEAEGFSNAVIEGIRASYKNSK
ncbi:MAG: NAD(P)-binding domain-containing protein [Alistipes sp.]|jgi:pyrroline-5-carboxylate reductase|nr:NAD(P)-binding domain-containing protein [Alistipes sp.]